MDTVVQVIATVPGWVRVCAEVSVGPDGRTHVDVDTWPDGAPPLDGIVRDAVAGYRGGAGAGLTGPTPEGWYVAWFAYTPEHATA